MMCMMNEDECGLENEEEKVQRIQGIIINNLIHTHTEPDENSAEIQCILWLATHIHIHKRHTTTQIEANRKPNRRRRMKSLIRNRREENSK